MVGTINRFFTSWEFWFSTILSNIILKFSFFQQDLVRIVVWNISCRYNIFPHFGKPSPLTVNLGVLVFSIKTSIFHYQRRRRGFWLFYITTQPLTLNWGGFWLLTWKPQALVTKGGGLGFLHKNFIWFSFSREHKRDDDIHVNFFIYLSMSKIYIFWHVQND